MLESPETPLPWHERLALRVLESLGSPAAGADLVREILAAIVEETGIENAGLRVRDGDAFPFQGFQGTAGDLQAKGGCRALACLCGAVLGGRHDGLQSFFTPGGSFHAGSFQAQSAGIDSSRIQPARDACVVAGFETLALVPLREGAEIVGLLHLGDRRREILDRADVRFLERLGAGLGVALAHRRAESSEVARLRQSEERWRAVVLNEPECVKLLDREGRLLDMNPAGLAMIQASLDQVLGRRASGLVAAEDRAAFDEMVAGVFRGERRHLVFDMIGLEGGRLTLETTSVPLWDPRDRRRVATLLGVTRDVTERKRAEEALKSLATSFAHLSGRAFFEAVSRHIASALGVDYVFVGRLGGALDTVRVVGGCARGQGMDELTYELAGTPCEHVVGSGACTYQAGVQSLFPGDRLLVEMGIEGYLAAPVRDKQGRPIGLLVALHSRPLQNAEAITALFGMFLERVSAEMQRIDAQEALEKSEERMRLFFERQIVGMAITTPGKGWVQVNQRFCQMLGYSSEELTRLTWADLTDPEDQASEAIQLERMLAGEIDHYSTERKLVCKGATVIHANLSVACVRRPDGLVDYVLTVLEDITERKRAQEAAKRSERMAAMGSLVAGVAHEVRNPLFAILANVDALGAVLDAQADVAELLEAMREGVERLRNLMDDLLEYGKASQPHFIEEALQPCLELALRECRGAARTAQVELRCIDVPGPMRLRLDRGRLAQVFENVVMNAIQHSPAGGQVRLAFDDFREDGHGWIRCRVEDQGPGFQAEDLARAFDPFYTRRRGGTGLGLSIAQRIVEEHGGRIAARNLAGGGACVVIELPAAADGGDSSGALRG